MRTINALHLLSIVGVLFLLSPVTSRAQAVQYLFPLDNSYTHISSFSDGLAQVEIAYDSIGFVNTQGVVVFRIPFEEAGDFQCGRAWVEKETTGNDQYGFIDKTGKVVIPCRYDEVMNFSNNRALVRQGERWWIINEKGETVFGGKAFTSKIVKEYGKSYYQKSPVSFHSGRLRVKQNQQYGYFDKNGTLAIPFQFDSAFDFSDGVALVAQNHPLGRTWKIIDTTGSVIYTFKSNQKPEWREGFSDGMLQFMVGREMGFISKAGTVVVPAKYSNNPYPFSYSDEVCVIQIRGQKPDNSDGHMLLKNCQGERISKIPFKTKYGLLYDSNHTYHEGLLGVQISTESDGLKWGYIDKQGHVVIPPIFDLALNFHSGRAVVETPNGRVNYIVNPLKN